MHTWGVDVNATPEQAAEPVLDVDGAVITYGYGDIVRGANLQVQRGSFTCIIGPNGAGKSTLLKAISGLVKTRRGDIRMAGQGSLRGLTPRAILERGVVHVAQDRTLFQKMSVWENVIMGAHILSDRALVEQRLQSVVERFPIVAERRAAIAGTLSGGQQRIVEIARAMMLDPTLILLDEPTLGLDPKARAVVFDTVGALITDGRTVLMVEQNAKSALRHASHGVVMDVGVVRLTGPASDLLDDPDVAHLYLGAGLSTQRAALVSTEVN
jgi:branched-chain amino acid transport system ATP-binding protein